MEFIKNHSYWDFPSSSAVKNSPPSAGDEGLIPRLGRSPGGGNYPVFWPGKIPWTEEPGRLQYIGLQGVGHDWSDLGCTHPLPRLRHVSSHSQSESEPRIWAPWQRTSCPHLAKNQDTGCQRALLSELIGRVSKLLPGRWVGLGARFLLQTGLLFSSVSASPLGREKKNQLKPTRSDLSSEQAILQGHPHQFPQAHAPKAFRNSKVYADLVASRGMAGPRVFTSSTGRWQRDRCTGNVAS